MSTHHTATLPLSSPGSQSNPNDYRADIDGLRAIAVLAIVFFHAFPSWVKGGFIGVDIFFVISGFLISSILFRNLENGSFRFLDFYSRRIRRIFPALLIVLAATLLLGWFCLFSDEFKQLGKHTVGGASFLANFLFWSESGYFDNSSDTKPLLHLWSLGIEEQFYILWPLILYTSWKLRKSLIIITALLFLLSFSLNVKSSATDPVTSFFLPHTRIWELLAGAILAFLKLKGLWFSQNTPNLTPQQERLGTAGSEGWVTRKLLPNILSIGGLFCLGIALLYTTKTDIFPGWKALIPVLGTSLIILVPQHCWVNRYFLSNRLMVWVGLISFPLYLWHWPLLTLWRIIKSAPPSVTEAALAVTLSFLLAWLTYRFIERPIRYGASSSEKTAVWLTISMIVIASAGLYCYLQNGLPNRSVNSNNLTLETGLDGGALGFLENNCGVEDSVAKKLLPICNRDTRETPTNALIGDSKGSALYRGLIRTSYPGGRWLAICGNGPDGAPAPIVSEKIMYSQYQKLGNIALDAIAHNPEIENVVFVTAARVLFRIGNSHSLETLPKSKHYTSALEGLENAARKVMHTGKNVILVVDNPTLPEPRDCLNRKTSLGWLNRLLPNKPDKNCNFSLTTHLTYTEQYRKLLEELQEKYPKKISIFDTIPYLCEQENNVCRMSQNGRVLYSYSDHISDYAAGKIGRALNGILHSKKNQTMTKPHNKEI